MAEEPEEKPMALFLAKEALHCISPGFSVIGSSQDCDIILESVAGVAGQHALLTVEPAGAVIRCLATGLWIDDKFLEIGEKLVLAHGADVIFSPEMKGSFYYGREPLSGWTPQINLSNKLHNISWPFTETSNEEEDTKPMGRIKDQKLKEIRGTKRKKKRGKRGKRLRGVSQNMDFVNHDQCHGSPSY